METFLEKLLPPASLREGTAEDIRVNCLLTMGLYVTGLCGSFTREALALKTPSSPPPVLLYWNRLSLPRGIFKYEDIIVP